MLNFLAAEPSIFLKLCPKDTHHINTFPLKSGRGGGLMDKNARTVVYVPVTVLYFSFGCPKRRHLGTVQAQCARCAVCPL